MSHCVFTNEMIHYDPKRGFNKLVNEVLSENADFISSYEQQNVAYEINLGKCLEKFDKCTKANEKKAYKIIDKHHSDTNKADYVNAGQQGYFCITSKINSTPKRGHKYTIAAKTKTGWHFMKSSDKKTEAGNWAKEYAIDHINEEVYVINEKRIAVAKCYFDNKYYKTKPHITETPTKKVVKAYKYIYKGDCYVG